MAAGGAGTRFELTDPDGTELDIVVMRRGEAFWVTTLTVNASERAVEQYPEILESLQLPDEPTIEAEAA